jgi:hypothetical protein
VPQVLVEFTDVATDVLVGLNAERYNWKKLLDCCVVRSTYISWERTWDETEREPFPAFVNSCAEVTAVLALCCDVLRALE